MNSVGIVVDPGDEAHLKHNKSVHKRSHLVRQLSNLSTYSHTGNQMGSTQDIGIILVQARGALRPVWSSFYLYSYAQVHGLLIVAMH
jgi:hypothetical protein